MKEFNDSTSEDVHDVKYSTKRASSTSKRLPQRRPNQVHQQIATAGRWQKKDFRQGNSNC